jgi:tartronate-semialdehyde synthase
MNFAVDLGYEGPDSDYGIDNVGAMEAMGALGRRVTNPEEIASASSGPSRPAKSGACRSSSR